MPYKMRSVKAPTKFPNFSDSTMSFLNAENLVTFSESKKSSKLGRGERTGRHHLSAKDCLRVPGSN